MDKIDLHTAVDEVNCIIHQSPDQHNTAMTLLTYLYETLTQVDVIAEDTLHGAEFDTYLSHPEIRDNDAIEAYNDIWMRVAMPNEAYTKLMYKSFYKALYGQAPVIALPLKPLPVKQLLLIEILGSTGKYEKEDIYQTFKERCITRNLADKQLTDGSCLFHMNKLIHDKFIKQEKTAHPLKSQYAVYSLMEKGRQTYTQTFGRAPVKPLFAEIIRAHDNLEHGLGIAELKKLLNQSHEYFLVSDDRKDTTIALRDGRTYIPDIIVKGHSSGRQTPFTAYFEYERDTHTQENFEEKMERALQTLWQEDCVKCIYIVTNNHENAIDLSKKVNKWVEKRGISLMSIRLRITTLVCIREAVQKSVPVNNMGNWIVSYNFQIGAKPKIIKPQITFNQKKNKA